MVGRQYNYKYMAMVYTFNNLNVERGTVSVNLNLGKMYYIDEFLQYFSNFCQVCKILNTTIRGGSENPFFQFRQWIF